MGLKQLYKLGTFNIGASLWITPALEESHHTEVLDWYLNFQITRSRSRKWPALDPHLLELSKAYETPLPPLNEDLDSQPLLIACRNSLPCTEVVVLPQASNFTQWNQMAFKVWKDLKEPDVRFFLPPSSAHEEFESFWNSYSSEKDISYIQSD